MKSELKTLLLTALLATALLLQGCSKGPAREKITDPEKREAFRTRNADIPVKSIFKKEAWKEISPIGKISLKMFIADYKVLSVKVEEELRAREASKIAEAKKAKAKEDEIKISRWEVFDKTGERIDKEHSPGYSPGLTEYFYIMLLVFAGILIYKIIITFFISPKK